ncbi:MAG: hypothetical protein IAG13_38675 [Deltaproteobacteria bacterium]|nr:hypothetical protein [Nannocystaceae bacterium]
MAALTQDWREFLSLLISHRVKFVVVGGHAVAVHAQSRTTEDLDIFVEASTANAKKLRAVLAEFGFGEAAPDVALLATPGKVFMIGALPFRIDVLTGVSGLEFAKAWSTRVRVPTEIGRVPFVAKAELIANKRASGRPKDLADLALLEATTPARLRRQKAAKPESAQSPPRTKRRTPSR